jgi:arginine utilization regulatory protein
MCYIDLKGGVDLKAKDYKVILQVLAENISEGVYIIDSNGTGIVYNGPMCKLEQMKATDVIGKNFRVVQSHIPDEESSLVKAVANKKTTSNYQQTFTNQYGKEITTINTTIPVTNDGNLIAAIEIARDVTTIREMSNTILSLQRENISNTKKNKRVIKSYTIDNLVGSSKNFLNVLEKCKRASNISASVLIYGETGTGKELVAQSIHYGSDRNAKPFLAQNCAALPENLLEGILFGTNKGAFTGAIDREGLFEQANGGTLLLDEISSMPYNLQSKLLRTLQEKYIRRLGGTKDIPIDVRIMATINEKADKLILEGKLREDLYYRLKIIEINIPPLRDRKEDILTLADYFIDKYCEELTIPKLAMDEKVEEMLLNYKYPGNVRELEHILLSAISMADGDSKINETLLELENDRSGTMLPSTDNIDIYGLDKYMNEVEKMVISGIIQESGTTITKAAKALGLKRQTLQYKLDKYNLKIKSE